MTLNIFGEVYVPGHGHESIPSFLEPELKQPCMMILVFQLTFYRGETSGAGVRVKELELRCDQTWKKWREVQALLVEVFRICSNWEEKKKRKKYGATSTVYFLFF